MLLSFSFATTIPSTKRLVYSRVWISSSLARSVLGPHPTHTTTKRLAPSCRLRRLSSLSLFDWRLEVHPLRFGRGTTLCVEATLWVLALCSLPRWRFSQLLLLAHLLVRHLC
jgi:hypothetical protein